MPRGVSLRIFRSSAGDTAVVKAQNPPAMATAQSFRVREISGTTEYMVVCLQPEIDTTTLAEGRSSIHGLPQFRLADGRALNAIDGETFAIVETGQRVRRVR
jgi:hypothetical protein